MLKNYQFHCPNCDTHLNEKESISLKTVRSNGDEGAMELSTTIGNYNYTHTPEVDFESGEVVDFLCPNCNHNLNSDEFENYAMLTMKVDENISFEVLFSRVAGVQKTYLVTEDGIESYSGNQ